MTGIGNEQYENDFNANKFGWNNGAPAGVPARPAIVGPGCGVVAGAPGGEAAGTASGAFKKHLDSAGHRVTRREGAHGGVGRRGRNRDWVRIQLLAEPGRELGRGKCQRAFDDSMTGPAERRRRNHATVLHSEVFES